MHYTCVMITGENFIGKKRIASSEQTFRTYDPQKDQPTEWQFYEASETDIKEATSLAAEAFKVYRNLEHIERAKFLLAIKDELNSVRSILIPVYCAESGLNEARAKVELNRTILQLEIFADLLNSDNWKGIEIEQADQDRSPIAKPSLRKMKIPLGPVVVFGASNFPLAYSTAGGDTASALAAGCPVIVKSHPMHAGTGEIVAGAIIRAAEATGMPDGVFSNLNSSGIEVGVSLVKDPNVKAVGFTGSIRGGRAIFDIANQREEPIPVFAEMGSINPVIISVGSLKNERDKWSTEYTKSITNGTGQFCTNPGLILGLKSEELDQFVQVLSDKINKVESSCMLHPNIKSAFKSNRQLVLEQSGVQKMTSEPKLENANYAEQTVVKVNGKEFLSNSKLHNEVFGPFTMVVVCDDTKELIEIIDNLEGQLTGTIIAEDNEWNDYAEVIEALKYRVGRIIFNGVPTGVEVCVAMNHGGPYPASTDSRFTAVGPNAIDRWLRSVTYQNFPTELLPKDLRNG